MSSLTYEEAVKIIVPGIYRHFKGNYYEVLYVARNSETMEPMVVYRALYGDGGIWVRPADMWDEIVNPDGEIYPRFYLLTREQRIMFYEGIYDELTAADAAEGIHTEELQLKLKILDDYYTSGKWREDFEADEAGLISPDLKRGVLSEDGVYDLLVDLMHRKGN